MKKILMVAVLAILIVCIMGPVRAQTTALPTSNNIVQAATNEGNLKTFTGAVDSAGLRTELMGVGPYTVFAPTDDAFKAVPASTMNTLMTSKPQMTAVVKNHIVPGRYTIKDLRNLGYVTTLDGKKLMIQSSDGAFAVDGAHIVKNDVSAGNGIIQVVDTVMIPK